MTYAIKFFRGVAIAAAVALVPAAAQAGGACFPKHCYQPCYSTYYPTYHCTPYYVQAYPSLYSPSVLVRQPVLRVVTPYPATYGGYKVIIHK